MKTWILGLVGACSVALLGTGAEAWQDAIHGIINSPADLARAVAVDTAGNVVAAGRLQATDTTTAFTVIKFDGATGTEQWRQVITPTVDGARAVAVNAAGDVVVAGDVAFTVIKFDGATGAERWRQVITGTVSPGNNGAQAVAVDAAGDVVAAGRLQITGTTTAFTVIKCDGATGAERWRQVIPGTAAGFGSANAVVVDGNGNVVAAGMLPNASSSNFTVVKLTGATGTEQWRQVLPPDSVGGIARAVVVDANGDVVAAGRLGFSIVLKFNGATGTERWRALSEAGFSSRGFTALAVDDNGDVVAAGRLTDTHFTVTKFAGASGTEQWHQTIAPSTLLPDFDTANVVAVDGAGDVVATGVTQIADNLSDFTVLKFDGVTGAERWRHLITGTTHFFHAAYAVAVDGVGAVVAAGVIQNVGTDRDFTVVKVDGSDGTERWREVITGTGESPGGFNRANAMVVDRTGDVVAAGLLENAGGQIQSFTVVKVDGGTGTEQWRRVLDGTAHRVDVANAVAVDGTGAVLAAGRTGTTDPDTTSTFTVVKLAGVSGTEQWRYLLSGTTFAYGSAQAVTVDGSGDVVAAGFAGNTLSASTFTVIKLAGASGTEQWRYLLPGSFGRANAVAVDDAGNVVAAGTGSGFTVIKLDGVSGTEQWRYLLPGGINTVAVDGAGDVVAAGVSGMGFTVVKLAGASGTEQWRHVLPGGSVNAVAVDAAGNVVAAGQTGQFPIFSFTVIKLDGASGTEQWRQVLAGGNANTVAVDAAGNVEAAGALPQASSASTFTVVKLDGASGTEQWRQVFPGEGFDDNAHAVAVDGSGDVVAAGFARENSGPHAGTGDFIIVKLRGIDGGDFEASCPLGQGFWKNHPGAWPVTSLTLGSQTYTQAALLALFDTPPSGDASLILADQLIAAKLNIANGSDPTPISATITDADGLLRGFAGPLPYHVRPSSATGQAMVNDASVLESYNNGDLTPDCTP